MCIYEKHEGFRFNSFLQVSADSEAYLQTFFGGFVILMK